MFKGKLVFAAGNVGDYDIFLYDLAANKLSQLTSDEFWNDYPRFSPDASQIAFSTNRSGKQEIWVMNADGSGAKSLTAGLKWADFPTWSPDGKEIAFVSNEYFQMDLFALNIDTGKVRRLTNDNNYDCYPDWSPNGKQIAFTSQRGLHQDIYILDLDTLQEKRLTSHPGPDTSPSFSPDGNSVAFVSQRPNQGGEHEFMRSFWDFFYGNEHSDVWTADVATGNLKQVTTNRGVDRNVRWSPDGQTLAYTMSSADRADARIMFCELDTNEVTPLKFDEGTVRRELERPFMEDLAKPVTPPGEAPLPESKFDERLEKTGERMFPSIKEHTPEFVKAALAKYEQREIDRINSITARYLDWK
jgi:Tol biopolymer transport system component